MQRDLVMDIDRDETESELAESGTGLGCVVGGLGDPLSNILSAAGGAIFSEVSQTPGGQQVLAQVTQQATEKAEGQAGITAINYIKTNWHYFAIGGAVLLLALGYAGFKFFSKN